MKKSVLSILLTIVVYCSFVINVLAQNNSISGIVTEASGEASPGVSVNVKGTSIGAVTDAKGYYKIQASEKAILVFSSIGFISQEVAVSNRTTINVVLKEDSRILNEVVVTALGIKREEKSLGFAATTVMSNAVVDAKSNNWVNTLSGKVAGLNIQGTGSCRI